MSAILVAGVWGIGFLIDQRAKVPLVIRIIGGMVIAGSGPVSVFAFGLRWFWAVLIPLGLVLGAGILAAMASGQWTIDAD